MKEEIKIGDKVVVLGNYGIPIQIAFVKAISESYFLVKPDCLFSSEKLVAKSRVEKLL